MLGTTRPPPRSQGAAFGRGRGRGPALRPARGPRSKRKAGRKEEVREAPAAGQARGGSERQRLQQGRWHWWQ